MNVCKQDLDYLTVMDFSYWHSGLDFAVHAVFVLFFGQISQTWDCR